MRTANSYWCPIESRFGIFAAWVDEDGRLLRFYLSDKGSDKVDPKAHRNSKRLSHVQKQIEEYDAGRRRNFDIALSIQGPEFSQKVWHALLDVPFGQTISYAGLARKVGQPHGARAIGAAMGKNPIALIVPCHRVIGSNGRLVGYGGGLALKRRLLAHEAQVAGYEFRQQA